MRVFPSFVVTNVGSVILQNLLVDTQKSITHGSSTDSIPFQETAAARPPERKGRETMSLTEIPKDKRRPLTIITVKDLSFCLEYRSVEIAGVCIDLTEKEFDILALLIMNQRQVYTYEMIMDSVWHDDFSFYSRNAISSHISNLRKKLKSSETASEHIKSIRGIGYKFEV